MRNVIQRLYLLSMSMEQWCNDNDKETPTELGNKPILVPLCRPEIPYALPWKRTWVSVTKDWRLINRAPCRRKKLGNENRTVSRMQRK
jgi:hypothetical protein